jgi:hypothetical protein
MKTFSIEKIGYSCGVYGCTGEYFRINGDIPEELGRGLFVGMYGAESRVAQALKDKGWKEEYCRSDSHDYQRKGEARKGFLDESVIIKIIKNLK